MGPERVEPNAPERQETSSGVIQKLWQTLNPRQRLEGRLAMNDGERALLDRATGKGSTDERISTPLLPETEIPTALLDAIKDMPLERKTWLGSWEMEAVHSEGIRNVGDVLVLGEGDLKSTRGHYASYVHPILKRTIRFLLETTHPEFTSQITHANRLFPELNLSQAELAMLGPIPLKELKLSARPYIALVRGGMGALCQLLESTDGELMLIRNFGESALNEVKSKLLVYLDKHVTIPNPEV